MASASRITRTAAWLIASVAIVGCASSSSTSARSNATTLATDPVFVMSTPPVTPPSPDPRVGLKAGDRDAGSAIWNMRLISNTQSPAGFSGITNSDLAFSGTNVFQGNYNGFQVWDVSNPAAPRLRVATLCPASQSDVSVYKNLLFVSAEAPSARLDCGTTAPSGPVSTERIRGLRIFDITNIDAPKYLANVQTCRGSHTHTVVHDPKDSKNVYVYISGSAGIRPKEELARCNDNPWDPSGAWFRIEVIKIPLDNPARAEVVTMPTIFADPTSGNPAGLVAPHSHGQSPVDVAAGRGGRGGGGGAGGRGGRGNQPPPPLLTRADSNRFNFTQAVAALTPLNESSTKADSQAYRTKVDALAKQYGVLSPLAPRMITQCHDITVYPDVGLAGGACGGYGLLLDISDVAHPKRLSEVADSNFSYWHSATFSNDGSTILFTDEWGGGGAAYCRAGDPKEWGANAIFRIVNGKMVFQSYYKLPAAQTQVENCVAHNGSLIPVPGRSIKVQGWYQGGISIFDWTDPKRPYEIAFFDRGPLDSTRMTSAGFWSVYWFNGLIYGSEIKRGIDVFELTPSAALSQNEIDAAKSVRQDFFNPQDQMKYVWPATFALSRAYTDQLERWRGLTSDRISAVRAGLSAAEGMSGSARKAALDNLATEVGGYTSGSDPARLRWLTQSIRDLAKATR
jgi:hypothetical protein